MKVNAFLLPLACQACSKLSCFQSQLSARNLLALKFVVSTVLQLTAGPHGLAGSGSTDMISFLYKMYTFKMECYIIRSSTNWKKICSI